MNPYEKWIAYYTIVHKECTRFLRIWPQTLLPSAITMSLYFLVFGHVIGNRIGDMSGFDYIVYITPGLIMMSVITNAYANVVSSFFGARYGRVIEEILVSPISNHLIIFGYVTGGLLRGLLNGFVVIIVAHFFTDIHYYSILKMVIVLILCGTLFSLAGLVNGIFAQKFDDTAIIPTFVLTPLIYLGGVFYSILLLPPFWQTVSKANPIYYIIDLFRYAMLGISPSSIMLSFSMVVCFIVILYLVCWQCLQRGYGIKT